MIAVLLACNEPASFHSLAPYDNPFTATDPLWSPQPHRDKPTEVATAGRRAWVTLPGHVDEPGDALAVVDLDSGATTRVEVGASPSGVAVHPDGDWLVALSRYSDAAFGVDAETGETWTYDTDYYATEAAFSPDGGTLWVTNRWRDEVEAWTLDGRERVGVKPIGVGQNPRDVAVSPDGSRVAVANLTGLDVSLIDAASRTEVARVRLLAPPNGLVWVGDWLVVPTLSGATHHPPDWGPDGDGDGAPGDGTPNVNFQDLQSEIAVIDGRTGEVAMRYTSDTLCCRDYRDVHPEDLALRGDLLPPPDRWIVGGALPEQIAADGDTVWVTYSSSDQLQSFTVDPGTGALTPGPIVPTAHGPHGVAVTEAGEVLVAERLSESLAVVSGGAVARRYDVGDVADGAFPATDAELGELFNQVTARFTVDGDQSCVMCHREGGNIDKAVAMPLARHPGENKRMVNAYRGAYDSRPWFFEGAMDQTNFRPVINEFARVENFCCEDYTLFPDGAPADCADHPPPECTSEPNAGSINGFDASRASAYASPRPTPYVTRDAFFLAQAEAVMGRTSTFGDGVYDEDPVTGERTPLDLKLEGITRALGLFLLSRPNLLPNPNDPDTAVARRGRAIFEDPAVGCANCHPAPAYTASTLYNPAGIALVLPPVVSPTRDEDGINLDLLSNGFISTFPTAEQDTCDEVCGDGACDGDTYACDPYLDVRFNPSTLRGIWDRATSMLHDGRARGLREVLCTPGHPALAPGEVGRNELDGIPDSHGATSHLPPEDVDALITFLETL